MNKMLRLVTVCLTAIINLGICTAQERQKITTNDEIIIKRKAIGIIDDLANKYNQLLDADSEERNIIIDNMVLMNNENSSTFVDDQVYIEDDFNTRDLNVNDALAKKVSIYFKDMCFNYGREDNGNYTNDGKYIIFSNIRTSKIMALDANSPIFIKVFFDLNYTGVDKRTSKPFVQPCSRVAEVRIEKNKNSWLTSILTIRFMMPNEADLSRNVTIQQEALTLESRKTLLEIEDKVLSKVTIKSNVSAARVKIDGSQVGYLKNGKFDYFVKPGVYKFELSLEKHENSSIETVVKADSSITLEIPMKKLYSNVSFKVEPNDAIVLINNQPIGNGTFTTSLLKGRHDLIVDKKGYKPEKTTIDIVNDDTKFEFKIYQITKSIEITTSPTGAAVTNNGDTLGKTPLKINLPYGQHNLIIAKENYIEKQLPINIENSGVERFDVLLLEKPEYVVEKEATKLRSKAIVRFFVNGGLAVGSYTGYNYFNKEIKAITPTSDSNKDLLNTGKYASIGFTGLFGILSTVNLVKIFTINKSKLLRKQMEQNTKLSFIPIRSGGVLAFSLTF